MQLHRFTIISTYKFELGEVISKDKGNGAGNDAFHLSYAIPTYLSLTSARCVLCSLSNHRHIFSKLHVFFVRNLDQAIVLTVS